MIGSSTERLEPSDLLTRRFVTLVVVLFAGAAFTSPLGSLLPAYVEEELQYPTWVTGALVAASLLVAGPLFLVGGALADTLGYKRTLLIGLAGSGICGFIFLAFNPAVLFGASVLIGVAFALHTAGAQSYLLGTVAAGRLGIGGALFFISVNLGGALGNVVFGPLADGWGYVTMGWAMVGGIVVIVVAASALLPGIEPPISAQRRTLLQSLTGYGPIVRRSRVRWLLGIRFLPTCMWGAATVAFPYLIFTATDSLSQPAFYTAASLLVATCGQLAIGRLCDHFGRRWPVRASAAAVLVFSLLAAVSASSLVGLWICGIGMTVSAWSLSTTMPGLMSEMSTPQEKGRIVGAAHLAWALGMVSGSAGAGWLLQFGPSVCYYVGSVCCAGAVVCAWRIFPALETTRT